MNKTLVAIACAAALLVANSVSAQDAQFVTSAEGAGEISITPAGGAIPTLYTEGQPADIQIRGQAGIKPPVPVRPIGTGVPGTNPVPAQAIQRLEIRDPSEIGSDLPPNPPRKTNREIIEYVRKLKAAAEQQGIEPAGGFDRRIDGAGGSVSGQARLIREDIGGTAGGFATPIGEPGKPVFFRASTTPNGGPGQFVRTIAASGSRAIFLREGSSTAGLRLGNFLTPPNFSGRVISSTTADGNVIISFEQKRPPMQDFVNQIFNLFRKVGGQQ